MLNLFTVRIYRGADRTYLNGTMQIQNNWQVTLEQHFILTTTQDRNTQSYVYVLHLCSNFDGNGNALGNVYYSKQYTSSQK